MNEFSPLVGSEAIIFDMDRWCESEDALNIDQLRVVKGVVTIALKEIKVTIIINLITINYYHYLVFASSFILLGWWGRSV